MPAIVETISDYLFFLQYDKGVTPSTIRGVTLALSYFTELYGQKETEKLSIIHIHRFHEQLRVRTKSQKNTDGSRNKFSDAFIHRVMSKVKSYIKWLSENEYLNELKPSERPMLRVPTRTTSYLTKTEMKLIMDYLETQVKLAEGGSSQRDKYYAYLRRALIWLLYTTGLRNAEIRAIKIGDIDFEMHTGFVIRKGNKHGVFSFNEIAKQKVLEYLAIRTQYYPEITANVLFTGYDSRTNSGITEQYINRYLKKMAKEVGITKRVFAHLFRHSVASHLLSDGVSLALVRDKLSHANIAVTSVYLHTSSQELLDVTKGLKF